MTYTGPWTTGHPLSWARSSAEPSGFAVVVPVTDASGAAVFLPGPDGVPYPEVRSVSHTPELARLRDLFASVQPRQVLFVHHAARALVRMPTREGHGRNPSHS
ncbi:hypothetical protein [Archangium violaceum]|uniref:Uncharacterized protein n=1 Tax=Archangium violaceum Cb vi76 TaxID=1406225 RepID=A0A084SXJ6_9BACT|nr:hypothetical protein [Archangium violaceum]KFA93181.1 hypothetical protein Q664_10855 [Archangium violaceum Cb vi76]